MRINDSRVIHMIKVLDAKMKINIFDNETENLIFSGYVYQTYDNKSLTEKLENLYISDMSVDYDGVRLLAYDKWRNI